MKVSRPHTLKLNRDDLLADVRARLERRLGAWQELLDDPSDPGWMLVEEAAWMVEVLSEQLDQYPWAVLRQVVHLLGGRLRPARPAIGLACLRPVRSGRLTLPAAGRQGVQLVAPATERREAVRFVPLEEGVPLVDAHVASVAEVLDGRVSTCGRSPGASPSLAEEVAWVQEGTPSEALVHERLRFRLVGARTKELREALERGVAALKDAGVGWLVASVIELGPRELALELRVDPGAAFSARYASGLAPGGDVEPDWAPVEGSGWTPPVRVADDPRLPLDLRLAQPLPGTQEGRVRVPSVPRDFPLDTLLVREPSPMPEGLADALWSFFVHADLRLAPIRPRVERGLELPPKGPRPPEADWLGPVLAAGAWGKLVAGHPALRLFYVKLPPAAASAGALRFALVDDPERGEGELPVRAWAVSAGGGLQEGELPLTRPWSVPLPPPGDGGRLVRASALEVPLEAGLDGVLIATTRAARALMLNAALVGNLLVVTDNRDVTVQRTVPTPVSLLDEDLVTREVMAELLSEPLPPELTALLRRLPLSRVEVSGEEDIDDLEGVEVDASSGELVLNSPDAAGQLRTLRPGTTLTLRWYRRTQGADGNVEAGAMSLIEQGAAVSPRLVRVSNPLATWFGQDREADEIAVERIFGRTDGVPVLAADWEREVRVALGTRGAGWLVRAWTYAERAHLSGALWPWDAEGAEDASALALRRAMERAGPEVLLVFVGESGGVISDRDLDWARRQVEAVVRRVGQRVPSIRRALVARLWSLTLDLDAGAEAPPLPCYAVDDLRGTLVDPLGRRAGLPRAEVVLNAPVVKVVEPGPSLRDPYGGR